MGIITTVLMLVAGGTSIINAVLQGKAHKLSELDKEFKNYEHDYEIKKIKLEEKVAKGNKLAKKQLEYLTEEYNKTKSDYTKARYKLVKREKAKDVCISRCKNCGEQLPEKAKFCLSCGEKVAEETVVCSRCGEENPTKAKFCSSCGNEL